MLYEQEKFALLERAMGELATAQWRYPDGDTPAAALYWAFRTVLPVPVPYESEKERIGRWRTAVPDSRFVTFAEARLAYVHAWNARGQRMSDGVSQESWELFGLRLNQAEEILSKAPPEVKGTPIWYNLMLAISQDRPSGNDRAEAVFEEGIARWPEYLELYEVRLTRLTPNWGGSWQNVEAFIAKATARTKQSEGNSMYARLYSRLAVDGFPPGRTAMKWPTMKRSLDDLVTRYPDDFRFKNLRASFACFARDKEAFTASLKELKQAAINPREWLDGYSYDACMRWAGI